LPSQSLRLPTFPLIRSTSIDESAELQSTINAPVEAEQLDRRVPFSWEANRIVVGPLAIVASQYGASVHASAHNVHEQYSLMVPLGSGGRVTQAGRSADLIPGRSGVVTSRSMPADFVLGTGYRGLAVTIPARAVEGTLHALTGASRIEPLRFDVSVATTVGGGADALRLLELMIGEAERGTSVLSSPLIQGRLAEAFVCALLLGVPHNHSHLLRPVSSVEPGYVRRAEEYIEANAHGPLTAVDLAAAAGIGVRALAAAFRKHRGCSPMDFVRQRRFELARQRLLAAPATTVAEVALSSGFEHLGRFSVAYRSRFGESAADTLRRARRAASGTRRS